MRNALPNHVGHTYTTTINHTPFGLCARQPGLVKEETPIVTHVLAEKHKAAKEKHANKEGAFGLWAVYGRSAR